MDASQARSELIARIHTTLDATYQSGHIEGDDGPMPIHPTGMRRAQGEEIATVLSEIGAKRTLETGFAFGLSTLFILRALLENGADPFGGTSIHTALDPFESTYWKSAGLRIVARAGASHLLRFSPGRSEIEMPKLIESGERFDAVLIDGDHRFESAFADLLFASRLVEPGGAIIVDDTWMPAVRAAVDYFITNVGLVLSRSTSNSSARSFVVLRVPAALPKRTWDHYTPFDAVQGQFAVTH